MAREMLQANFYPPAARYSMSLNVDLTLAVNYLPACTCLVKMLVFMLGITSVYPGKELEAFVILAAFLYMDRLLTRNIIFDANAILLAVFFANVHAGIRAITMHRAYQTLMDGMFLFWAMGSVVLICEPRQVKQVLERRVRLSRVVPVMLMLAIQVGTSHFNQPLESGGMRTCRGIAFTLLSFAWIYIIGVHATHGIEYLKENSCQFVSRLSPVLYVTPWIAVAFTLAATGGFAVQYMRLPSPPPVSDPVPTHRDQPSNHPATHVPAHEDSTMMITVQDLQSPRQPADTAMEKAEDSELFRLARMQAAARRGGLEPILEIA